MTHSHDETQATLERELAQYAGELSRLEKQEREIAVKVADLRGLVQLYERLVERRRNLNRVGPSASAPLSPDFAPLPAVSGTGALDTPAGRTPGNRRADMPERMPRFTNVSIPNAVLSLANEWRGLRHSNEFVRGIWCIASTDDLRKARRTLNSTIGRLARVGQLSTDGKARYGPKEPSMT